MKQLPISFLAQCTVNQTVELEPDVDITSEELINGLNEGKYLTTIGHPNPAIYQIEEWKRIGTVVEQNCPEGTYSDFESE